MTQEDKESLLKDIIMRLPYDICVYDTYREEQTYIVKYDTRERFELCNGTITSCVNIKPYLRPMSSMTDEEMEKVTDIIDSREEPDYVFRWDEIQNLVGGASLCIEDFYNVIDWLNKNHFDYRGFIEMRLALEAPEGMYKTN